MNIQQCKNVIAIAKAGSFSEAAKQLFVTQPSLSNSVKELEKELGAALFIRLKTGVRLTDEGVDFLQQAKKILTEFDLLQTRYQHQPKKVFAVSSQHYDFLAQPFLKIIDKFAEDYQDFHLTETTTQQIIDHVRQRKSELGILYLDQQNQRILERNLQQDHLCFEALAQFKTQIFLGKQHPLAQKKTITLEDLISYPQVRFTQEPDSLVDFNEDPLSKQHAPTVIYTNDRGTLTNFLCESNAYASGLGIVAEVMQQHIVLRELNNGALHTLGIISKKNTQQSEIAQAFIQEIKKSLPQNQANLSK